MPVTQKEKIRIGIAVENYGWNGGIDFLADFVSVFLENTDKYDLVLVIPKDGRLVNLIRRLLGRSSIDLTYSNIVKSIEHQCGEMQKIYFERYALRGAKHSLLKVLDEEKIDILAPVLNAKRALCRVNCAVLTYVFDFQHKHLPSFFTEREIRKRNIYFRKQLVYSDFSMVQSIDTLNDIKLYYPEYAKKVLVFPDYPRKKEIKEYKTVKKRYEINNSFFLVSNQFWIHKSHKTVFDALEKLYNTGMTNVDVVCTGNISDPRFPDYFKDLLEHIENLNCKHNIHILGLIPKEDQLSLMAECLAVIQPSLFEGNPGGGSVVDAEMLGIHCIVSDIEINKEILPFFSTTFFERENSEKLAEAMINQVEQPKKGAQLTDEQYVLFYEDYDRKISEILNNMRK